MATVPEFGTGKLRKKIPESIIHKNGKVDDFDSTFLVLALIFNDIKNYIYFDRFVEIQRPNKLSVNSKSGEFMGFKMHVFKLLASCISECMKFLEEKESLFKSDKFLLYVSKMSKQDRDIWYLLSGMISNSSDHKIKKMKNLLLQIRNNVSSHYYQSEKPMVSGFRQHFFTYKNGLIDPARSAAYYSTSATEYYDVRFFYADAALAGYLENTMNKFGDINKIQDDVISLSARILKVIGGLLEQYLKNKANA